MHFENKNDLGKTCTEKAIKEVLPHRSSRHVCDCYSIALAVVLDALLCRSLTYAG